MSTFAVISIILTVLGMISGIFFNFYRMNRLLKENEYKNVINSQRADISTFRTEVKALHDKIESLNTVIRELDAALIRSNAIALSFPFPFWYKSTGDWKMRMLNDDYCRVYKKCREDYLGRTDFDVWDKDTAERFRMNDLKTFDSQIGYSVDYGGEIDDSLIVKWRIPGLTKEDFYIAGISIPKSAIIIDTKT